MQDLYSAYFILHKLKSQYNIDSFLLRFIANYLSGRKQCVVVGGSISSTVSVTSGVPQFRDPFGAQFSLYFFLMILLLDLIQEKIL